MNNQIHWVGLILVGMLLIVGLETSPVQAATLTASDEASMVAAINSANANADVDIIELTADINLATTTPYSFNGATGLPIITKPLTINGNGHTIRRTSATQFRLLAANATQLWLEDITLASGDIVGSGGAVYVSGTGASLTLTGTTVGGSESNRNRSSLNGGAIYVLGGLTIVDSNVSYNHIEANSGQVRGAGIFVTPSLTNTDIAIIRSSVNYNSIFNSYIEYQSGGGDGAGLVVFIDTGFNTYNTRTSLIDSELNYNSIDGHTSTGIGMYYLGTYPLNGTHSLEIFGTDFIGNYSLRESAYSSRGGGLAAGLYHQIQLITISHSRFMNNHIRGASVNGGGLNIDSGLISSTIVSGNHAESTSSTDGMGGSGGGIRAGSLILRNSSVVNNTLTATHSRTTAAYGAAGLSAGTATIENSTFSGNQTIHNRANVISSSSLGSAISLDNDSSLNNVTVTGNSIVYNSATAVPRGAGILFNTHPSDVFYLSNSIIADNYASYNGGITAASNCSERPSTLTPNINSYGYNLIEADGHCEGYLDAATDIVTSITLPALADNGGFGLTHAISGIPPVNSGNPATTGNGVCTATDQRGAARVGVCDIGAYEADGVLPSVNTAPIAADDSVGTNANTAVLAYVAYNDSDANGDTVYFFPSSSATRGIVQFRYDGSFTYTPSTGFTGTDSFTYIACDNWGNCSSPATVNLHVNTSSGNLPAAPTTLRTVATSPTSIELAWNDNSNNETGFVLERSNNNGSSWQSLPALAANSSSHTDTNRICQEPYQYRLRAYRASDGAFSAASNILNVSTICPAPTNLVVTPLSYTSASFTWEDNAIDESQYRLEVSGNGGINFSHVTNMQANATSITRTNLTCGITYHFRVNTNRYVPAALSPYSNVVILTIACPPPPITPSNFTATPSGFTSIILNWTDTNTDEANYLIERSSNGGSTWALIYTAAADTTSYTNSSLSCATNYQYRIRAVRNYPVTAHSPYSPALATSTNPCPPAPLAPSHLTAIPGTQSILLNWQDNSSVETTVTIERSLNGTSWLTIANLGENATSYENTNLPCNTSYYYKVRASNVTGSSPNSTILQTSTLACPPATPVNLSYSATKTTITVNWSDIAADETAYFIERQISNGGVWTIFELPANSNSFTDTGLNCATLHQYRIRTYRASTNSYSAYTSQYNVSTSSCTNRPSAPSNIVLDPINSSRLDIRWNDNTNLETSYQIQRSSDGGTSWTALAEIAANSTSYSDISLACNQYYRYRVAAFNNSENSLSNWLTSINTFVQCAPTGLHMTLSSSGTIGLAWDNPTIFTSSVYVERSGDNGASWTQVAHLNFGLNNSLTDTGLNCGTSYQYRIRFYTSSGNDYSDYSTVLTASTLDCYGITEASCTLNQIDLSSHNGNTLGPVYMSGNGNRLAINYQDVGVVNYPDGMYLYDIASESIIADFPNAALGDINADGSRLVFMSSDNPIGFNADGNTEIFYWDNGTISQLTNTSIADAVGQPQISDDGLTVVFAGDGDIVGDATAGYFLYIWDATNGIRKLIPQAGVGDVAFSGDGTTVVFEHDATLSGQSGLGSRQLYRWNAVDGVELLFPIMHPASFNGSLIALHINSDGSRVLFTDNNDLLGWNPDETDDVFIWDENTDLIQLTESANHFGFLGSMDGSGNRVVFWTGLQLDADSTAPSSMGYYFYDEGYGYSQITSVPIGDYVTWGQSLSSDGLTAALLMSVGWDGVSDVQPFVEIFIADCTAANYLPAPSGLELTADSSDGIDLLWSDHALSETGYRIERSNDAGTNWTEVAQIAANSTSYSDADLACNTAYQYRVRAYRSSDNTFSDYSNVDTATTNSVCAVAKPTMLNVTAISETGISLAWTDNATDESEYRLERSSDAGASWAEIMVLAADSTSYEDGGISCNSDYQYRLRAYRAGDTAYSRYSNVVNAASLDCAASPAPSDLTITGTGENSIDLSWTDNASDETEYRLERSADSGVTWNEIAVLDADSIVYTDATLACATSYVYRLRAYRAADEIYSEYSNSVMGTSLACSPLIAPSDLSLTMANASSVTLGWTDNAANETEYRLERSADSGVTWNEIATLNANSSSYEDIGLLCSESYEYRLRAYRFDDEQYSPYSNQLSAATMLCVPIAPSNLALTNRNQSSISLGWTDNASDETEYRLERSMDAGANWAEIAVLAADSSSTSDTGLSCNTSYRYRLRAYRAGDGQYSVYSNVVVATTTLCPPPNAPSTLTTTATSLTSITLSWTDNSLDESEFSLERSLDGGASWLYTFSPAANSTSYVKIDLVCGTNYQFRLRAYRQADNSYSAYSNVLSTSTAACPPPNAPTSLTLSTITASSIRVVWTDNSSNETNFRVERSSDGLSWTEVGQATVSNYTNSSLSCWANYQYRVRAYRSSDGLYSDYTNIVTGTTSVCPAASNLTSPSQTASSIDLSWTDNAVNESNYRVERSINGGTSWTEIAQIAADSTSYSDSGLTCVSNYRYRVRAYRSANNQFTAYSTAISVNTSACPPPNAPNGLSVTGTSQTRISLAWTDNASDETSFSLERSVDGINWTEIQALAANTTSFTDITALCNSTYDYRIRAYRSGDTSYSSYSNVATATTNTCPPPAAPSGLTVSSVGYTNISLSWTDNASEETGYRVERSADSGASWTEIAQPAANATSYNDTTALCNTSYDYRVRVYRSGDSQFSDYSNVVTGTTDVCIFLNAPSDIQLTGSTETSLSLSWTDNSSNESGYEIERSLDGTNWTLMSSLPADSTSYSDSGLTCSRGYQYRIRSNHLGTGTYSLYGTSTVFTTVSCPALVASVLSSTGSTDNSISLSWTVDSNGTSFTLAYYNGTSWLNLGIFPASTTTYMHTGLNCGRNYQYQVTTFRADDSASVTSSAFSTSTAACPPMDAPNAPVVLNTEPALVSLQIPAMPATATIMSLERSTDGISWTNLGNVSSNYLDTSVVCGSSYQYRLVATRSSDGTTSTSSSAIALTDACPIPNVVGVYRGGLWVFVDSNNTATPVNSFNFGDNSWQPLVGDWDGDGIDGVGIYRNGEFALRNIASADSPETRFNFGAAEAGWQAIVGDWDGNGSDSVGLYKDGLFILSNDNVNLQYRFNFGGGAAWQAVAGDWDGNGADGIGLYKDGIWMLAEDVNNPDGTSIGINYGPNQAGWTAIVGDWNGDGRDSIGLYSNGTWRMRLNSINDASETTLSFGQTGDIPLAIFEN